jgi:hypothetical protein
MQTWLLFRPLIVFVLGCPLFILAVLFGLRWKPRGVEHTETGADHSSRFVRYGPYKWRISDEQTINKSMDCGVAAPLVADETTIIEFSGLHRFAKEKLWTLGTHCGFCGRSSFL